ncbi:MAG: hypothetical protein R3A46_20465 [Thermomicrobiales bacterium]
MDTIGLAYTRLLARPWVVLGPVLLDLYLWLGLKITAGPLVLKLADIVRPVKTVGNSAADFLEGQEQFNLAELASMQLITVRMPTFLPLLVTEQSVRISSWKPAWESGSWWLLALIVPLLLLAGYAIGAIYLQSVGHVARDLPLSFDLRRTFGTALDLLLWLIASIGLFLLIAWPVLVLQGGLIWYGTGIVELFILLLLIPAGIGFVLFFFSVFAIVLDGATAIQAYRSSYRVVRAYGWQSIVFIVSFMVVTGGFPFFWRLLIDVPPGTLIAIIGNAFVSTGMIAAGMIYYEDRAATVELGDLVPAPIDSRRHATKEQRFG